MIFMRRIPAGIFFAISSLVAACDAGGPSPIDATVLDASIDARADDGVLNAPADAPPQPRADAGSDAGDR